MRQLPLPDPDAGTRLAETERLSPLPPALSSPPGHASSASPLPEPEYPRRLRAELRVQQVMPKAGNRPEECEDALAVAREGATLAMSDGASSAIFARLWAELLTRQYAADPTLDLTPSWLEAPRHAFTEQFAGRSLPWYTAEKLREGSFATLLGLQLDLAGGRWQAVALGDSCLFQIRRGRLIASFPLTDPDDFGNTPFLVPSAPHLAERALRAQQRASGTLEPGDSLVLATDALAQWLLRASQERRPDHCSPWASLRRYGTRVPDFAAFLARLRASGALRNDDVAVVLMSIRRE